MNRSPYVLANNFRVSKTEAELENANSRDEETFIYKNEFLANFKISKLLKISTYNVRPSKMKREDCISEIEALYEKRTKDEIEAQRAMSSKFIEYEKPELGGFSEYVYACYKTRFSGGLKLAESKLLSLLATVDYFSDTCEVCRLFHNLVNEVLGRSELSCFLLLRNYALSEVAEMKRKDPRLKKKCPEAHMCFLSNDSCFRVLQKVFPEGSSVSAESIYRSTFAAHNGSGDCIPFYSFLSLAVNQYRIAREKKARGEVGSYLNSHLSRPGVRETPKPITVALLTPIVPEKPCKEILNEALSAKMKNVVEELFGSLVNEEFMSQSKHLKSLNDARDIIHKKMQTLLTAMFTSNKMMWFEHLLIPEPDEDQLNFADIIFKDYRVLSTRTHWEKQELEDFCKRILKTPQANEFVSSLLTFVFGTIDNDDEEFEDYENEAYGIEVDNSMPQEDIDERVFTKAQSESSGSNLFRENLD